MASTPKRLSLHVSDTVKLSGVPSHRPELQTPSFTTVEHEYGRQTCSQSSHKLGKCHEGMCLIRNHEAGLQPDIVHRENTSLPNLEKRLFRFSASSECRGILYMTFFEHREGTVARIIETGCFEGATSSTDIQRLLYPRPFLHYHVFSPKDIQNADRNNIRLDREVKTDSALWKKLQDLSGGTTCLKAGLLFLKRQRSEKCYFHTFGEIDSAEDIQNGLIQHILHGQQPQPDFDHSFENAHLTDSPSLQEQLSVLCLLSNLKSATVCKINQPLQSAFTGDVGHLQHFSTGNTEVVKHMLPYSLRNRLIHFSLAEKGTGEVFNLLNPHVNLNPSTQLHSSGTQPKRKRSHALRVKEVTLDDLRSGLNDLTQHVPNMFVDTESDFSKFTDRLVEEKGIYWRMQEDERDVFLMNAYDCCSGAFLPQKFVMCECLYDGDATYFSCSCDTYKLLTCLDGDIVSSQDIIIQGEASCMHCRFLKEHFMPNKTNLQQSNLDMSLSQLYRTLIKSKETCNAGVVQLTNSNQCCKFSVRGKSNTLAFVHMSGGVGACVSCQSGECEARSGSKRSVKRLQSLATTDSLCPHLDMFKGCREQWIHLLVDMDADPEIDPAAVPEEAPTAEPEQHRPDEPSVNGHTIPGSGHYDPQQHLWDFGGLSRHKPTEEHSDKLRRNIISRLDIREQSYPRDENGFMSLYKLLPSLPQSCACGAGFLDVDEPDGVNLFKSPHFPPTTNLYTRNGAVKCVVFDRKCQGGGCHLPYCPDDDSLHFWSRETAVGDELGYDFINAILSSRQTFTAFCHNLTRHYRSNSMSATVAPFISVVTFLNWWFSWAAAFGIDFRNHADPFCKANPNVVAGDGTHIGITLKNLDVSPIDQTETDESVPTIHRRFDRVFLHKRDGFSPREMSDARSHLKYLCAKTKGHLSVNERLTEVEENQRNLHLLNAVDGEESKTLLRHFIDRDLEQDILCPLADVLHILACDAPISAFIPFMELNFVETVVRNMQQDQPPLPGFDRLGKTVSPEFKLLFDKVKGSEHLALITSFVLVLIDRVRQVHSTDRPSQPAHAIHDSYNPENGVCYYFTPTGEQLRKLPQYEINQTCKGQRVDDLPCAEERCEKQYPRVSQSGYSHMFLWFCPVHGHCWGFHIISGGEGRKDPFSSLFKYMPSPPKVVFYDNACQLSEYSLNREPDFFKECRFFHDCFHGFSHKCAKTFRSRRLESFPFNTEICEQFNARLQCIKYTGTHLCQPRFIFLAQFMLYLWNKEKTANFQKKMQVALRGTI